uniref:Sdh3 n=1 Tax=Pterocladiophila hemisphaerica TaxID=2712948 RepID=A0A6M3WWX3_9FLOR|nr:Sdh3 [Pterocladiophila hemisphaerica]
MLISFFNMYNRPISPHLTIYNAQIFSIFSIWHRISGIFLSIFLYLSLISYKLFITLLSINFFFKLIIMITLLLLFYHSLNGLRSYFIQIV